jgi:hypothetical protein
MAMQRKFLLIVGLNLFATNCVSADKSALKDDSPECPTEDKTTRKASDEIQKKWQKHFLMALCKSKDAREGWALFDQGGLAGSGNFGQVMLIQGSEKTKLIYVDLKDLEPASKKTLDKTKWDSFLNTVGKIAPNLKEHWAMGFDMFEKEFVHVTKEDGKLTVQQRVKWRFGTEPCVEHCDIEKAFHALVK